MVTNGDKNDPLETVMIHGSYTHIIVPMATIKPMATMVSLAPVASLAQMAPLNGDVRCVFYISNESLHIEINDATGVIGTIGVIDINGINEANGIQWITMMLPLAPLTPMASMKPINRHLHQWIANVSNVANSAIDANDVINALPLAFIGDCGRHVATRLCLWCHLNCTSGNQWWLVIATGTNGDRYWHQWWSSLAPMVIGCTIGTIRSIAISAIFVASGSNDANGNRYDSFTNLTELITTLSAFPKFGCIIQSNIWA